MLPPLAPAVLERNPRFKDFYRDLSSSRLNPDGTTRLIKQQRAQADLEKNLQTLRTEAAQDEIIVDALRNLTTDHGDLNLEQIEACQIVAAFASGQLTDQDLEVLQDDIDHVKASVGVVAAAVSAHLQELQALLMQLITTDDKAQPTNLAKDVANLQASITNQRAMILQARLRITEQAEQVHVLHREVLESSIRVLEQVLHGSAARGLKARAEHLSTVAKGLDLKIQIMEQTDPIVADASLSAALYNYTDHLNSVERGLISRRNKAQDQLREYERLGSGMNEIASKYAQLMREVEEVKEEIARLEQS